MTKKTRTKPTSERAKILNTAARLTSEDRNDSYGDPSVQMKCFEIMWNTYQRNKRMVYTPGHDACIALALMKISRIACGLYIYDNYVDAAAYIAMAGEIGFMDEDRDNPVRIIQRVSNAPDMGKAKAKK